MRFFWEGSSIVFSLPSPFLRLGSLPLVNGFSKGKFRGAMTPEVNILWGSQNYSWVPVISPLTIEFNVNLPLGRIGFRATPLWSWFSLPLTCGDGLRSYAQINEIDIYIYIYIQSKTIYHVCLKQECLF